MGIDWTSPSSLKAQSQAITEVDTILFGIMLWEVVVSFWFDRQIITRKREFKWPILVYWATKYATLAFSIGIFSVNSVHLQSPVKKIPVDCQALSNLANVSSQIGKAGASSLLMLRAMALWGRDLRVVVPLAILHLGQWAVYFHNTVIVREHWENMGDGTEGCQLISVQYLWIQIQFIYAMVFDFIVLIVACAALLQVSGAATGGHSRLWKLLFIDGMSYFVIAFVFYLACVILAYIKVSVILTYIVSDSATVLVSIAACRSFVRVYVTRGGNTEETGASTREEVSTGLRFAWTRRGREGDSKVRSDVEMVVLPSTPGHTTSAGTIKSGRASPEP